MPGTAMTIAGNLALQSGALYVVYLNGTTATLANVTGTAALAGTVQASFARGTYLSRTYDLLHASGLSGTFSNLITTNAPPGLFNLDYTATDVFLDFTAQVGPARRSIRASRTSPTPSTMCSTAAARCRRASCRCSA